MIKKVTKYLLICVALLSINSKVYAEVDFNKLGSISITLKENEEELFVEGAELSIYKIANVSSKDYNLFYEFESNLSDCEADLSDLLNPNLTDEILACMENKEINKQSKLTNDKGNVKFEDLKLGIYLVKQTNSVEGYSATSPFLVSIPKTENNEWLYDIIAEPKTDIIRLMDIYVEKKWDNISNNTPKEVTIELLKNGEVVDTVILNNENNWKHVWKQIEKSDEYSVKEINIPKGYTATYRQVDNTFIVTNTKVLVQTGYNILIIELLAIFGLLFIVGGYIYDKRKNYE